MLTALRHKHTKEQMCSYRCSSASSHAYIACQMKVNKTNVGSGDFWNMLCQYTLWPECKDQKSLTTNFILCQKNSTCKPNTCVKVRRCRCGHFEIGMEGNDGAALDIADEVNGEKVKRKEALVCQNFSQHQLIGLLRALLE